MSCECKAYPHDDWCPDSEIGQLKSRLEEAEAALKRGAMEAEQSLKGQFETRELLHKTQRQLARAELILDFAEVQYPYGEPEVQDMIEAYRKDFP